MKIGVFEHRACDSAQYCVGEWRGRENRGGPEALYELTRGKHAPSSLLPSRCANLAVINL